MASEQIEVRPVRGRRERARFIDLPYRLHRTDPSWVAPLRQDARRLLDRRNPFFEHGEACFWLAWRKGVPVGRISAQINRLHLEIHKDDAGHFGFLEALDDQAVFTALLNTAARWLRDRGMRRMVGPYSLSMNDDIGILVDGFDTPPVVGMPHAPRYYAERIAGAGLVKIKDVHALRAALSEFDARQVEQIERVTAPLRAQGRIGLRFLDLKRFDEEMKLALEIYNDAWSDNWGFLPVTEAEVKRIKDQLAPVLPPKGVIFALADGVPVAVVVALPNLNELIADLDGRLLPLNWIRLLWRLRFAKPKAARVVLMGVRKRFRRTSLSAVLVALMLAELFKASQETGIEMVEFSWILEDNRPSLEGCLAIGARFAKRYRIYTREL